ncbi:transketolase C-terminal domain-containing protein [Areca yellow leaf disease phytoplasma]|uniref:transketolase C-terminal domain-containing protein n=1 Tax=Areca yellow leaf disease phytoplasma TaxID=927614 RepID=UPI0035B4FD79
MEPKKNFIVVPRPEVPETDYEVQIGKAKVVQEGTDITVVAWGAMVLETLLALKQLYPNVSIRAN